MVTFSWQTFSQTSGFVRMSVILTRQIPILFSPSEFKSIYNGGMDSTKPETNKTPKITKVLVIDSDDRTRDACRKALENHYLVLEANSGISGIDLTKDTEPDLILLGIDMPDMNGFEVASRLQNVVPKTPIVALAEPVLISTKDFGLAVGFYGYLQKPISSEEIVQAAQDFINGKRETTEKKDEYLIAFQSELAHRLEMNVREQADFKQRANYLIEQNNIMIDLLERRRKLLEAAAASAKEITSILEIEQLLPSAAKTIKQIYDLDFFGIYLVEPQSNNLKLAASAQNNSKEPNDGPILECIEKREGVFSITEPKDNQNQRISIIALPLTIGDHILGAVEIIPKDADTFEAGDLNALQILADQLAIAIQNANTLTELENANQEILRAKTFEAIATATGEAIHWVGNKAAPISGSATRVREDLLHFLTLYQHLLSFPKDERQNHPFRKIVSDTEKALLDANIDSRKMVDNLTSMSSRQLQVLIDLSSTLEDLSIIERSAQTILNIKEDLIGPARKQDLEELSIQEILRSAGTNLGLPKDVLGYNIQKGLPTTYGDRRQLERVYTNLLKNAWEALQDTPSPTIKINAFLAEPDHNLIQTEIIDNGPGIPPEIMDKIWVSFFTTKKQHGGTGLGLSASMEIINQAGGHIYVESPPNEGTKFVVLLPAQGNQ